MRVALDDAAPLYRDAPEAKSARAAVEAAFETFLGAALPEAPEARRLIAADLIAATLAAVGKRLSETPLTPAEVETAADAMADMFSAYLASLA